MSVGIIESGQEIVTNGLVLHLDAAQRRSYPTTGTTWTDLSGSGNTGTLTNNPSFSTTNGGSIVFDGTDDSVSTATSFNNSSGTWSVWLNTNATNLSEGIERTLLHQSDSSGNKRISLTYNNEAIKWSAYGTSSDVWTLTNYVISPGNWYNITGTYNGTDALLYVNGNLPFSTSQLGEVGAATLPLSIGKPTNTTGGYYSGKIGIVSIYNRALSGAEVLQNYNATKSRFGL
jgi:hypothetical protein